MSTAETGVLIAGAGLSGLALAANLERQGVDYLLVEARQRVGGRILSLASTAGGINAIVDMGPSWLWPGQARSENLLREFGLAVFEQHSLGRLVYEDERGQIGRDYDFSTMAGSLRIDGGMASLTRAIAQSLSQHRLHLSHRVKQIREVDGGYEIGIATGAEDLTVRAGSVVLSIPPRVIVAGIDFEPPLATEIHASLASIPTWMAGHAKLVAIYSNPFWREQGLSGDGISRRGPLMEIHDASPADASYGALFGFVGLATDSPQREADRLVADSLSQLQQMYGAAAINPVDVQLKDWARDACTATAADHVSTQHPVYGMPPALAAMATKGLLLASTEMAPVYGGFVEGALEAAEFAFEQLQEIGSA